MSEPLACESCKQQTNIPTSIVVSMFGGKEIRFLVCPHCGDWAAEFLIGFIKLPKTS